MALQKALSSDFLTSLRPNHRTFHAMQAARRYELFVVTEHLRLGLMGPETWADNVDAILFEGHRRAWRLGRQRADDIRDAIEEDDLMGRAAKDRDADYLASFLNDIKNQDTRYFDDEGRLRTNAVLNRANLYVGRMRGTAGHAFVAYSPEDEEFQWVLGAVEKHCEDCPRMARLSPFTKDTLFTTPGDGDTECLGNCKCYLRRSSDGLNAFKAEPSINDQFGGEFAPEPLEPDAEDEVWPTPEEVERTWVEHYNNNVNSTFKAITSKGTFFLKRFDDTESGIEGEFAAKDIADALGFGDWIPRSATIEIDFEEYFIAEWREGKTLGEHRNRFDVLQEIPKEDRVRLLLFDYLLGNVDRHINNLLIDPRGNPVLIDHERAFESGIDWRPRAPHFYDLDSESDKAKKGRFRINKNVLRRFLRERDSVLDIAVRWSVNAIGIRERYKILEELSKLMRPTVSDLAALVERAGGYVDFYA